MGGLGRYGFRVNILLGAVGGGGVKSKRGRRLLPVFNQIYCRRSVREVLLDHACLQKIPVEEDLSHPESFLEECLMSTAASQLELGVGMENSMGSTGFCDCQLGLQESWGWFSADPHCSSLDCPSRELFTYIFLLILCLNVSFGNRDLN